MSANPCIATYSAARAFVRAVDAAERNERDDFAVQDARAALARLRRTVDETREHARLRETDAVMAAMFSRLPTADERRGQEKERYCD